MNNLFKMFSFIFLMFNTPAWSCETLDLCMAKFYQVADESSGISTDESQLAKKIDCCERQTEVDELNKQFNSLNIDSRNIYSIKELTQYYETNYHHYYLLNLSS